jgi:hypothetical protein
MQTTPVKSGKISKKICTGFAAKKHVGCDRNLPKNSITPEMLHYTFMPAAPESWKKNKNTWLTSTDISRVMLQYEHKIPAFYVYRAITY